MSATIEERLARYSTQLDAAARTHAQHATRAAGAPAEVQPAPPERPRHHGRHTRLVALGAAVCLVAALAVTISVVRSDRNVNVSTVSTLSTVPTIGPVTTSESSTTTATTVLPTTTVPKIVAPTPGTQQITYQPFTATGTDPRLHVTQHLGGTCFSPATALPRGYRCFADGGDDLDPCFAGPHGTAEALVCPTDPLSPDVVELTARSVTAEHPPPNVDHPWAMQLSNGQLCRFVSAAWGSSGPYSCAQSGAAQPVADCHVPAPGDPSWTADCQDQLTDTSPFAATRVVTVWY